MREIQYISPSALSIWKRNPDEYYLQYLSDNSPPREAQTQPMAIGSAFDAYVKSYLYKKLYGDNHNPKYDLDALIEAQVEPQNRDWARDHGRYTFEQYKQSGALADLMLELGNANGEPRFEFEVRGAVFGYREPEQRTLENVTLLGKPDCTFTTSHGQYVVLDFKVNGYQSRTAPSPLPGYIRLRSAGSTHHGQHKNCQPMMVGGIMVNVATFLDTLNNDWASQLSIYAWLSGEPVGARFVTAIDQLVCDATRCKPPAIRIAEHRLFVSETHQRRTFADLCELWDRAHSDHFFREMSKEDSIARCQVLDRQFEALKGEGTSADAWFTTATRG